MDGWSFTDIARLPDVALTERAEIFEESRNSCIPPLQALANTMAMIPKKQGHKTIGILATFHRLLMQLGSSSLDAHATAKAFKSGNARAGCSAIQSSEDRALQAELGRKSDAPNVD